MSCSLQKKRALFLGLGIFLYQSISYAKTDTSSSLNQKDQQSQIIEQPIVSDTSKTPVQATQESKRDSLKLPELSLLSVKGELGMTYLGLFFSPLLLELQKPITNNNRLKWLIQAGGGAAIGATTGNIAPYFTTDTGLRYDFSFYTTVALTGGAVFFTGGTVLPKASLSVGWEVTGIAHVALNVYLLPLKSSGLRVHPSMLSLSVSVPIKRW